MGISVRVYYEDLVNPIKTIFSWLNAIKFAVSLMAMEEERKTHNMIHV